MDSYVKLIAAAAAALVVAVAGCQPLSGSGGAGGEPTITQSPSLPLLASGTFNAKGALVELEATGDGDSVTGTMAVADDSGDTIFAVDLECSQTADDGRILIGGNATEAADWATKGEITAIILKPGSPVHAVFAFQDDDPSADTCMTFLEAISDMHFATAIGDGALEPIEGTVELRP